MDRISSDFRAALRRHVSPAREGVEPQGLGVPQGPHGTMTPPSPMRSSPRAGFLAFVSSGWFFLGAAVLVTLGACWLVITLFGCAQGCCGGVAW